MKRTIAFILVAVPCLLSCITSEATSIDLPSDQPTIKANLNASSEGDSVWSDHTFLSVRAIETLPNSVRGNSIFQSMGGGEKNHM
jgi:hypothetical protein